MADDGPADPPWRIAVAGLGDDGWHLVERLRLRPDVQIVAAWDPSAEQRDRAAGHGLPMISDSEDLWTSEPQGLVLATTADFARPLLAAHRCPVLLEPATSQAGELHSVLDAALATSGGVWLAPIRRWDEDPRAVSAVVSSGRLGRLRSLEWRLSEWSDQPAWCEADLLLGLSRLILPLCDQLAGWCELSISRVETRIWPDCLGLWLRLDLAHGVIVEWDLRRQDLVPVRTGWMIRGDRGGYSEQRLITRAADGELIDEPVRPPAITADPLFDAWLRVLRNGLPDGETRRQEQVIRAYRTILAACSAQRPPSD
jgi:hypothetical protein